MEFPEDSKQKGWDLLVDGNPVQVKNTMYPEKIKEHLEDNPDISVIVNSEMATYFEDNDMVRVDQDMSLEKIENNIKNTFEEIDSIGDGSALDIPVATLIFSSFREGKLLYKGETDKRRAVTHVGVDTTSVGGGGTVGAKVGTTIGCFGGPSGAAVGMVVGSIIGATSGRFLGKSIKQRKLKKAIENLNNYLNELVRILPTAVDSKIEALDRKKESIRKRLGAGGIRGVLWPKRRDLLFLEIKRRLNNQKNELINTKNKIQELQQRNEKKNGLTFAVQQACEEVRSKRFFHPKLNKIMKKVNESYQTIVEEKKKLGMG